MPDNTNQQNNGQILAISGQYIKNLKFERILQNFDAIQNQNTNTQPKIDITINLAVTEEKDSKHEVTINSSVAATFNEEPLFNIHLAYSAVFTIKNFSPEQKEQILLIHCPTIMFPFVRRILSDVTRDAAFPPLMIDIVDFFQLYNQQKEANKEQKDKKDIARLFN